VLSPTASPLVSLYASKVTESNFFQFTDQLFGHKLIDESGATVSVG
jgi:hypothetical protein